MKKLHFRRFFRPITTIGGGSTAGPPPEHHHMGRRFSCTSCTHVWHSSHTHSATHMSTHPYSPPPHLTFLFFSLHSPLPTHSTRNPQWTLGGSPDILSHHSFSYLRFGKKPQESHSFFSRQSLQKHTQTSNPPGRQSNPPGRRVRLPVLFFHFHHFPLRISLSFLHEISSTHPKHYNHTLSTTIPSIYLHQKLSSIETSRVGRLGDKLELVEGEGSSRRLSRYLESPRSCWPTTS